MFSPSLSEAAFDAVLTSEIVSLLAGKYLASYGPENGDTGKYGSNCKN